MAEHEPVPSPALILQPMVHVEDMPATVAFYERLGGAIIHGSRDADWVLMQLGTTQLSLLAQPPLTSQGESTVELNFQCAMPLDQLEEQLSDSGATIAKVTDDRTFGPQLHLHSPDGLLIKINEVEPAPYL